MYMQVVPDLVPVLTPHFPRHLRMFNALAVEAFPEAGGWRVTLQRHEQPNTEFQVLLRWGEGQKIIISARVVNVVPSSYTSLLQIALHGISSDPSTLTARECSIEYDMIEADGHITVCISCWLKMSSSFMEIFCTSGSFSEDQRDLFFSWMDPFMDRLSICADRVLNLRKDFKDLTLQLN